MNDQDLRFNLDYPQFLVPLTYHQLLIVVHFLEKMIYSRLLIADILADIIYQIWSIIIPWFLISENKHKKSSLYLIIPVIIFIVCSGHFEKNQLLILNVSWIDFKYCLRHNFRVYSLFDYRDGYHLVWLGINLNKLWAIIPLFAIFHYAWENISDLKTKSALAILDKRWDKNSVFIA